MRFAMTARTLARKRAEGDDSMNEITALNVLKVTKFRPDGERALEKEVERIQREQEKKKKESEGEVD